jgi:hypothetical protein
MCRASDTFIRLQSLIETFAAACSGGLLLGDGGGIELLLSLKPGVVALRRLFIRAAAHEARHCCWRRTWLAAGSGCVSVERW